MRADAVFRTALAICAKVVNLAPGRAFLPHQCRCGRRAVWSSPLCPCMIFIARPVARNLRTWCPVMKRRFVPIAVHPISNDRSARPVPSKRARFPSNPGPCGPCPRVRPLLRVRAPGRHAEARVVRDSKELPLKAGGRRAGHAVVCFYNGGLRPHGLKLYAT